jgi:hypothetical protein
MNDKWCEIRTKRARDLSDDDIIRVRVPGHELRWREIFEVFHHMGEVEAVFSREYLRDVMPEAEKLFDAAFEHKPEDTYVVVRLMLQEDSTGGEIEDACVMLDALDLVEVQSLPKTVKNEVAA